MRVESILGAEHPILLGYDGSRNAIAAFGWAQREAIRRHAPLVLVYVYEWGISPGPVPSAANWPERSARREAEAAVDEVVGRARAGNPELSVRGVVIDGPVVSHLRKFSERARLLVVGDRGLGGFPELRAGSVATDLAAFARCPVVIVRGSAPPADPVVVGVDESPDSDLALRFAYEQASARGVGVLAVRGCQPPPVPHRPDTRPTEPPAGHLAEQRRLAERLLAGWPERFPHVPTEIELLPGGPADALIAASQRAQLAVVGAHGHRGYGDVPLGPTAGHLIQYAHCPVAVVRHTAVAWAEPGLDQRGTVRLPLPDRLVRF